jgi:hypothetical protein
MRILHLMITDAELFSRRTKMSFAIYAVGYLILIVGLGYLAHLMHIPQAYIVAGVIILAGIGIVTGVQSTRQKDPN